MPEPLAQPALRGLVLAGGASRRFGADKAALRPGGGPTLLERAAALLEDSGLPVHVAVRPGQDADPLRRRQALITDVPGISGPAAGLLGAHRACPLAAWLVIACDMPLLDRSTLARLLAAREGSRAAIAFRGADGRPEPLCAIYEPATLARLGELAATGGDTSLRRLLERTDCLLLDPPPAGVLASANTPDELHRLLDRMPGNGAGD